MKFKKILAVLLSVSMLGILSACGEEETSKKESEVATETVAVEEEETEEVVATEAAVEEDVDAEAAGAIAGLAENYDPEKPEETVLPIIEGGFAAAFGENMSVNYDDSNATYTINVWQAGFAEACETEAGAEALSTMSGTLESSLLTMTEQIRALDDDANITLNFVSDVDQETVLLTIENGVTTYVVGQ